MSTIQMIGTIKERYGKERKYEIKEGKNRFGKNTLMLYIKNTIQRLDIKSYVISECKNGWLADDNRTVYTHDAIITELKKWNLI